MNHGNPGMRLTSSLGSPFPGLVCMPPLGAIAVVVSMESSPRGQGRQPKWFEVTETGFAPNRGEQIGLGGPAPGVPVRPPGADATPGWDDNYPGALNGAVI